MTGADLHEAALELVRRSRAAQGLPELVSDPVILASIAALMSTAGTRAMKKAAPALAGAGAAKPEVRRDRVASTT